MFCETHKYFSYFTLQTKFARVFMHFRSRIASSLYHFQNIMLLLHIFHILLFFISIYMEYFYIISPIADCVLINHIINYIYLLCQSGIIRFYSPALLTRSLYSYASTIQYSHNILFSLLNKFNFLFCDF